MSTLVNILAWLGDQVKEIEEVDVGSDYDDILRRKAEGYIRTNIFFLWKRFDKIVLSVADYTKCARAKEGPQLKADGQLSVEVPKSRCKLRECNNANFFQSQVVKIGKLCAELDRLERQGIELSQELLDLRSEAKQAMAASSTFDRLYDYNNCLKIGDLWMHLECLVAGVKDFATTNYKESQHLCPALGLEMKRPESAAEKSSD